MDCSSFPTAMEKPHSSSIGPGSCLRRWPSDFPGTQNKAIATYCLEEAQVHPPGEKVAGIDLGEIHMAVSHDGEHTHILNGRLFPRDTQRGCVTKIGSG